MGHKVNPTSLRLQVDKNWQSKWFASRKDYTFLLQEDLRMRRLLDTKLDRRAGIDRVEIERSPNSVGITLHTARPGVVIGRGGSGIEDLKTQLQKLASTRVTLTIEEIKKPELRAKLVAENIAGQLERRISFRRAIKSAADSTMRAGARGVKIKVAGRLGGSEMARRETEVVGSIPLHTLRASIDYAQVAAKTTKGIIGIKVWINKDES